MGQQEVGFPSSIRPPVKALVTGAGGFLGGAIARALKDRGDEVRGFSRAEHPELAAYGIEQYQGDLVDPDAVAEAANGVHIVFHTAAKVGAGGRYADFHATNIAGTANVIRACREGGMLALVHTSTPSVVTSHKALENADESASYATRHNGHYSHTKAEAERLVLSSATDEFKTVALRPPIIWGPGDTSLLPRIIQRAQNGSLRRIRGRPAFADITFINDAVRAHLTAGDLLLAGGQEALRINGRPYFVSAGTPVEIWDFLNGLLEAADLPPIQKTVGLRTALVAAWFSEKIHTLMRRQGDPRMSRWIVRQLTTSRWFDISAAKRDIGYEPLVSMEDGMRRLKAWFEEQDRAEPEDSGKREDPDRV